MKRAWWLTWHGLKPKRRRTPLDRARFDLDIMEQIEHDARGRVRSLENQLLALENANTADVNVQRAMQSMREDIERERRSMEYHRRKATECRAVVKALEQKGE